MPDRAEVRLLRLATFILEQDEPVTRERIEEAFPGAYGGSPSAAEKRLTRDKDALRRLGFALRKVELGDAVGYVIDARACALPPIELAPDEAAVVWTAAAGALRFSAHPLAAELESALRKLMLGARGFPPRAAPDELAPAPGAGAPGRLLAVLAEAWERRRRLTVDYFRASTGEVVRRDVDVYGWASRRGEWIFVGHCHLRGGVRIFYLSRVRQLRASARRQGEPDYEIPEGFDVRRWSRQEIWEYDVHPPRRATVRLGGSLARLAGRLLPGAALETGPDGSRLATVEVRNLRGLVRQALAWGPEAELLAPEEGRELAREILATLAAPGAGRAP